MGTGGTGPSPPWGLEPGTGVNDGQGTASPGLGNGAGTCKTGELGTDGSSVGDGGDAG